MLNWRVLVSSYDPSYTVKGTELAVAFVKGSRFAIYEVRALEPAPAGSPNRYELSLRYRVRDALTVSDAEVRLGTRPRIVFEDWDLDKVLEFCHANA